MAEFTTFYWGFLTFIICCGIGLIMSFFGGQFIDTMVNMQSELPGHDSSFATQTEGQVYWFINLYYLLMYCIPILGAIIFGQAIIKRVRQSQYTYR
jgi:hypothetical protein